MKPCPYRRDHDWEWDGTQQTWLCIHCYAKCTEPDAPMIKAIIDVVQADSEKPTPVEPMPTLEAQLKAAGSSWQYRHWRRRQ